MTTEQLINLFSAIVGSIISSYSLTQYKIVQLQEKVSHHNDLSTKLVVIEEQFKMLDKRIDNIEDN